MKINLEHIFEGWRNHLFPPEHLKEIIKHVSQERLAICNSCSYHSKFHKTMRPDDHCTDCGCTLSAKTACLSCYCELPIPKWKALVTEEQEEEMNNDEKTIDYTKNSS
jgi:hypothetical protein